LSFPSKWLLSVECDDAVTAAIWLLTVFERLLDQLGQRSVQLADGKINNDILTS
jgi:hypothetical protein